MAYLNMTDNALPVNYTVNQFSTSFFFRSEVNEKVEDRIRASRKWRRSVSYTGTEHAWVRENAEEGSGPPTGRWW